MTTAPVPVYVTATIAFPGQEPQQWTFDWNDRLAVRRFAADADLAIRSGASTSLCRIVSRENPGEPSPSQPPRRASPGITDRPAADP